MYNYLTIIFFNYTLIHHNILYVDTHIIEVMQLYRTKYKSERDFKESLARYMTFYNTERPHSIIKYWTPDKWESKYWNKNNRT